MGFHKIYCHLFPNGKRYIGQTVYTIEDRSGKNGEKYNKQPILYHAIQKYGWDSVEHFYLEEGLTQEEANIREQYYIKLYKTSEHEFGYNQSLGGKGFTTIDYESVLKEFNEGKTIKQIAQEGCHSARGVGIALETMGITVEERLKNSYKSAEKRISQYSLSGKYIKTYESITKASYDTNISVNMISENAREKRESAGGYIWKYYTNEEDIIVNITRKRKDYRVSQYDFQNNFIAEYISSTEAAKINGWNNSTAANIREVCNGKRTKAQGYRWKWTADE